MAEKRIRISRPEEKFIYIDKAVGKLLPSAGESELKVLLYALCEQEFSVSEAAAYLKLTVGEVESALCFWRGRAASGHGGRGQAVFSRETQPVSVLRRRAARQAGRGESHLQGAVRLYGQKT